MRLCLSYYVMRTSPHKHRVCAALFPRFPFKFVPLCVLFRYAYFTLQTSGLCSACTSVLFGILHACVFMFCVLRHKHRVCAVLFPRLLLSFYACVCHVLLCVLCLTNIGFVQCFSLASLLKSLYAYVCRALLCVLCLTNIGFVKCLSLGPLLSLYVYLCHVMLCVLHLTNISFVQCFSPSSLLSLHAYIGPVLLCVFFDLHGFAAFV